MVCSCRKATGNLRKTGVYHDGRNVSLGQGRLFGAAIAGARLVWFGPVRSMKRDNAENQRARIAPGLDRHGIGWPGCRGGWRGAAGRIGCQRADGASDMPKGRSSMAGFVCLPFGNAVALGVRCVLGQPRASVVRGNVVRPVGGVWRCRGQRGWLAGGIGLAIDQNRHSGRNEAQRRPGIHAPLKETGFPPSRE
jgi:hypothetical protein